MTSEIKLIALDLDGTLLNSKKEISDENKHAIQSAREKGVHVVITTGRPLRAIEHFLEELKMKDNEDFSITFNGGLVQRNTGEILSKKTLTMADATEIKKLTNSLSLPCDVLNEGTVYVTKSERESLYRVLNKLLTFKDAEIEDLPKDMIVNKVVSCTDADFLDSKIPEIPQSYHDKFSIFKTQAKLIEFMPRGVNKAYGLSKLSETLNLAAENVMAMGDEENDLSMIEWAGYGVAMANAISPVKEKANIISNLTNEENAVAEMIKRYVL